MKIQSLRRVSTRFQYEQLGTNELMKSFPLAGTTPSHSACMGSLGGVVETPPGGQRGLVLDPLPVGQSLAPRALRCEGWGKSEVLSEILDVMPANRCLHVE